MRQVYEVGALGAVVELDGAVVDDVADVLGVELVLVDELDAVSE